MSYTIEIYTSGHQSRNEESALCKLSKKYLKHYYAIGGENILDEKTTIHKFWHAMEKKFRFKIVWTENILEFEDEQARFNFIMQVL